MNRSLRAFPAFQAKQYNLHASDGLHLFNLNGFDRKGLPVRSQRAPSHALRSIGRGSVSISQVVSMRITDRCCTL